jgi:hypothetical protein
MEHKKMGCDSVENKQEIDWMCKFVQHSYDIISNKNEEATSSCFLSHISTPEGEGLFTQTIHSGLIATIESEFLVKKGRIDFLISHIDGSLSIIEIKKSGDIRDILAGIGQLSLYYIQLSHSKDIKIRRVLVWDCERLEDDYLICQACESAGVIPYPLGKLDSHIENVRRLFN